MRGLSYCLALEASITTLLHKIPCILHAENHIGIKLLTMVLMEGFSKAFEQKKCSYLQLKEANKSICCTDRELTECSDTWR